MKKTSKTKKILIIAVTAVILIVLLPFIYSEYQLISGRYTKAGDFVEIIKVSNDSRYEVLRTVNNKNGEDEQVVVTRDLSEFTELIGAEYNVNRAPFRLSDGGKCYMTHAGKNSLFCGKIYDYNIFVFSGTTIAELLADDKRECIGRINADFV